MFFSNQEPGMQLIIYSYITTADDFIAAWQAKKSSQYLIEQALFNKTDTHFYPAQSHILSTLVNAKPQLVDHERLYELAQSFLPKLANTNLSLSDVLSGLKLLSAIYQVPLDMTPIMQQLDCEEELAWYSLAHLAPAIAPKALIPPIKELFSPKNARYMRMILWDERQSFLDDDSHSNALSCLTTRVHRLDVTTLASLKPFILERINYRYFPVCNEAFKCLIAMVGRFDGATLKDMTKSILIKVNDENSFICERALHCLTVMVPKLDRETLESLVQPILVQLDTRLQNEDEDAPSYDNIPKMTVECLRMIIPSINDIKNSILLINFLSTRLDDKWCNDQCDICEKVLDCVEAIVSRLDNVILTQWIHTLLTNLDNKDSHSPSHRETLKFLATMVPKLDDKTFAILINYVKARLENNDSVIFKAALGCLAVIVPKLDVTILMTWINPILAKLDDRDNKAKDLALNCLKVIAPRLDTVTLMTLINLVLAKLDDNNDYIERPLLDLLKVVVSKLDATTLVTWVNPLLAKLDALNQGFYVYRSALNCLKVIASKLDATTLITWVNPLLNKLDNHDVSFLALDCLIMIEPKLNATTLVTYIKPLLVRIRKSDDYFFQLKALACLRSILPRLDAPTLRTLIHPLLTELGNRNQNVPAMIPNTIAAIVYKIDDMTFAILTDYVNTMLDSDDKAICKTALDCLTIMALRLDALSVRKLGDCVLSKLDNGDKHYYAAALNCLTAIVPRLEVKTFSLPWITPILAKLDNTNSFFYEETLNCLTAIMHRLDNEKVIICINLVLANFTLNHAISNRVISNGLTEMVKLAQSNESLMINLIEQLVLMLSHSNNKFAQTCFKLTLHLLVDCDKESWSIDGLLQQIENSKLLAHNDNRYLALNKKTLLLAQVIYPWLAKINQQIKPNSRTTPNAPIPVITHKRKLFDHLNTTHKKPCNTLETDSGREPGLDKG
jgi:serine/threonine-protein phosphatase 2A regulatory subunit A